MALFASRGFAPLFVCQFLGALNDNILRSLFIAMIVFGVIGAKDNSGILIQLSVGLFILPFFLFSAIAGRIADRIGKRPVLIYSKAAELAVITATSISIFYQSPAMLLVCIFFAGAQSAFFGPVKYSLLPALLPADKLVTGNALFSTFTFASILLGYLIGTYIGRTSDIHDIFFIFLFVTGVIAILGFIAAVWVPRPDEDPDVTPLRISDFYCWQATNEIFRHATATPLIFRHLIAISIFWSIGSIFMGELPNFGEMRYEKLLSAVVIGVGVGGLLSQLLVGKKISVVYTPVAAVISVLWLVDLSIIAPAAANLSIERTVVSVIGVVAALTLYVVPLYASLQHAADITHRSRVIAALNIINAAFIVIAALIAIIIHAIFGQFATAIICALSAIIMFIIAFYVFSLMTYRTLQKIIARILRFIFRLQIIGFENLPPAQAPGIIICNHVSLWDSVLLAAFLPDESGIPIFAIDPEQAQKPWVRVFLNLVQAVPLSPLEPHNLRHLARRATLGENRLVMFPEGRITVTGKLMKVYPGAGVLASKSDNTVIPIHISGAEFSMLSQMKGKRKRRWFPHVKITIFPPQKIIPPPQLIGHARRAWQADTITRIMETNAFVAADKDDNLVNLFFRRATLHGASSTVFCEPPSKTLSYRTLHRNARALGNLLKLHPEKGTVGILLPTSLAATTMFYAAIFSNRIPVMLNVNAGANHLLSAIKTAQISHVYTARALLKIPAIADIIAQINPHVAIVYLEDARDRISVIQKLSASLYSFLPSRFVKTGLANAHPDDTACILFTSGSEGIPKGVALSHRNLAANCAQILSRLDATSADSILNALPVFHSFGLTAGVVLPVLGGIPTWLYPSPLHYRVIPEIIYLSNATIFFSADTFLANYARVAHAANFRALRLVIAGAEKLRDTTRQLWMNKFGIRILEGYGVTESSPVLAFNTPEQNRNGSVGRILPHIETRLETIEGIGGKLLVRGPNIMKGYILSDNPEQLQPPPQGWHDTGDIAQFDDDGYLTIIGRVKRFAKIAGEMAPMNGIEDCLKKQWPEHNFAVVATAHEKRGEILTLVTDWSDICRQDIIDAMQNAKMPKLWIPRRIVRIDNMPLLTTGKPDYQAIIAVAQKPQNNKTT